MTDAELIDRSLRGDPLAERALYERHVDAVYRTAFRLSGDHDVAVDYTQDTFIKAFARLHQFRGDAAFATWLRAITASVVLTGERKRARFIRIEDAGTLADTHLAAPSTAFDIVGRIAAELDVMPERLRSTFLMHDVEGFTHVEIAAALDVPVGTSKARLSEARARLRTALTGYTKEQVS